MKLLKVRAGLYSVSSHDQTYRIRRLPVKSRGWHAELYLGGGFWTATRYHGRTLREVVREMSASGIRVEL